MPPFKSFITSALFGSMVAGCGGNPFDFTDDAPFGPISDDQVASLSASYDTLSASILDLSPTAVGGLDTAGDATFSGMASLTVSPEAGSDSMTLIGDAVLIADFDTRAITANMINFAGTDMNGMGQRLDGSLSMDAGTIGLSDPNGFAGAFQGTLVAEDFEIVADGVMEGTFRSTPATALSFTGLDDTAQLNGERASLSLTGIAQE
ncbi:MAG: hypothetical protein AAFQ64_03605 [Pseudomonadota bacterium]